MKNKNEIQEIKRTVYVDMDGVLADFNKGFYNLTGLAVDAVTDVEMWNSIQAYGKDKYFSELEWMPGGKDLWNFVTQNFLQVKILSALGKSDLIDGHTTKGKMIWLRHNLPALRQEDIILVKDKHRKRHYSQPGDIIIDDHPIVIDEWAHKGGIGILHKTLADTVGRLKQYV